MIKNIIARGIGFNPGSTEFIVTHGFGIGIVTQPAITDTEALQLPVDFQLAGKQPRVPGRISNQALLRRIFRE